MILTHINEASSLPNHLRFNQMLNKALTEAKAQHSKLALVLIKIENFFQLSTQCGLSTAHHALQELDQRFKAVLQFDAGLTRLEVDELALFLPRIESSNILDQTINNLVQTGKEPIKVDSMDIKFILSMGIALSPQDGETLETLEKKASFAQSRAKQAGDNHFHYYAQPLIPDSEINVELQNALPQAFNNNEFTLYYQPKLNLKEKVITGVEALIRWNHPQYGILTPSKFFSLAENTGFDITLGEWIMQEACHTNKQWQDMGYKPITMSVNLSPKQFHLPELTALIERSLQNSLLDPCYLDLEITEMTVMDDVSRINDFLSWIKNKGISISIDDFGTGHTAIRYLKDFPINILKIDQSFIKDLPKNKKNAKITCDMVSLAHELGMQVVAEGVETMEQLEFLAKQQCDMVQGYFISRPLPASQVVALFEKNPNNN